jgi:hypothetical protein
MKVISKILFSLALISSTLVAAPMVNQANAAGSSTFNTCYPVVACDPGEGSDPVEPDSTYIIGNATLQSLAQAQGISTGSNTADAIIAIGASAINPYVGGTGSLVVALANDAVNSNAELAQTALNEGGDIYVYVKENASGYPAVEVLDIEIK